MCSADPTFISRAGVDFILASSLSQFPNEQVLRKEADSQVPIGGKGISRVKFQKAGMCTSCRSPAPCLSASPVQTLQGPSWNFSNPEVSCHGPVTQGPLPSSTELWSPTAHLALVSCVIQGGTNPAEKLSPGRKGGDQGSQFPGSRCIIIGAAEVSTRFQV